MSTSNIRNEKYIKKFPSEYFIVKNLLPINSPVIFDVGAHTGETISEILKYFKSPIIHAFEPQPSAFKELCDKFRERERESIVLNNIGLGNRNGKATFFANELNHTSSFLKVNPDSKDHIALQEHSLAEKETLMNGFNKKTIVDITTVDRYCALNNVEYIDLLKIDTQGYEVECLGGGVAMLGKTKVIKCELTLFDYYEKSNSFFDVENIIREHGFKLYAIPFVSQNPFNGRTDWVEVIYVNTSLVKA